MGRTRDGDDGEDGFPTKSELRGHPVSDSEKAFQHKDDDGVELSRPTRPDPDDDDG